MKSTATKYRLNCGNTLISTSNRLIQHNLLDGSPNEGNSNSSHLTVKPSLISMTELKKSLLGFFVFVLFALGASLNTISQVPNVTRNVDAETNNNQREIPEFWKAEPFGDRDFSKELVEKRDAFSKHFDQGDGNVTAHIASGPIHYQENGEWKTIYHTIAPTANGFENIHNSFKTYYPATATGEIKTILPNGGTISDMISMKMYFEANGQKINVQSIKNAPGQASFNELTYTNAYGNGIDLRLTQNTTKRKMDYIIHSLDALGNIPSGATHLVFEESVELPQGWTAELKDNVIYLKDANGQVQALYEKPTFEEAPKEKPNQEQAQLIEDSKERTEGNATHFGIKTGDYAITQNGTVLTIKTKVDIDWLLASERNFPVTIDPTLNCYPNLTNVPANAGPARWTGVIETSFGWTYNPNATTAINSANISASGDDIMILGTDYVYDSYWGDYMCWGYHSWAKFNTSNIPDNATINSVNLFTRWENSAYVSTDGHTTGITLRDLVNDPVPATNPNLLTDIRNGDSYSSITALNLYNTSAFVNTALGGNAANNLQAYLPSDWFGVGFHTSAAQYGDVWLRLYGRSHANKPYITVDYSTCTPSTAPTSITASPSTSICSGSSATLTSTGGTDGINAAHVWSVGSCPQVAHIETFSSAPSSLSDTYVNSITNGILNVTSTSADPMIHMPNIGTFPAATYKYINIRYKTTSNTGVQIYYSKNTTNSDLAESQQVGGTYINDGNWHNLSIDMAASPNWTGNIYGWRFDWATTSGATVEIDFIELATHPVLDSDGSSFITVAPTATTEYYARKVDNCGTTSCASITIHLNESSTPPTASTGGGNYCHGNNITLTQSGGTDGTGAVNVWYAASGETSPNPNSCDNESYIELWNDFKYNDPTCEYSHQNTSYSTSNGILQLETINTSIGTDPFIWMYPLVGNATIDANTYEYVNVRYKITNLNPATYPTFRMGVLFTKESGCGVNPYPFTQPGAGSKLNTFDTDNNVWHTVSFKMSDHPNWNGTITGLRFDYFDKVGNSSVHNIPIGSKMEVDFIIVSKHPMIGEGTSITLSPGDEYYPTETTTYYAKKIDNCGQTNCVSTTVTLPNRLTTLGLNNESATCNVNAGETVHFYHSSGRYLASITANPTEGLGSTVVTNYTSNDTYANAILVDACDNISYQTATLGRHWLINPTYNKAATVILPYYNEELNSVIGASLTSSNPNDAVGNQNDLGLSKYSGPNNMNDSWSDNCPSQGGNGGTTWQGNNGYGDLNTHISSWPINTANFSKFNITSFSEFWLHATGNVITPLSVEFSNFRTICQGNITTINWTTHNETNSDYFIIERSRNGYEWDVIDSVKAIGGTNLTMHYSVNDTKLGEQYYRIKEVTIDGKISIFGPIISNCEGSSNSTFFVYPNPNNGTFNVVVNSNISLGETQLFIHDVTGKIVYIKDLFIESGNNSTQINQRNLEAGTYFVSILGADKLDLKPVKLIIH